jgi:hypothetical protein
VRGKGLRVQEGSRHTQPLLARGEFKPRVLRDRRSLKAAWGLVRISTPHANGLRTRNGHGKDFSESAKLLRFFMNDHGSRGQQDGRVAEKAELAAQHSSSCQDDLRAPQVSTTVVRMHIKGSESFANPLKLLSAAEPPN